MKSKLLDRFDRFTPLCMYPLAIFTSYYIEEGFSIKD
jgi:hypothetical protein